MDGKFFIKKDNPKSAPVTIVDDSGIFYKMSNHDMVLKTTFSMLYEPMSNQPVNNGVGDGDVDPTKFFSSTKFGQVFQPEHDKNYLDNINNNIPNNAVQQQPVEVIKVDNTQNSVDDELYNDEIAVYGMEEANRRRRNRMKGIATPAQTTTTNQNQQSTMSNYNNMSPSEMMFKTFKRSHEIVIKLEFNEKIGQPDFVRMMLENIDGDIVQYYTKLIMDDIMSQVSIIEQTVSEQIKNEIFGDKKKKNKKTPTVEDKKENNEVTTSIVDESKNIIKNDVAQNDAPDHTDLAPNVIKTDILESSPKKEKVKKQTKVAKPKKNTKNNDN